MVPEFGEQEVHVAGAWAARTHDCIKLISYTKNYIEEKKDKRDNVLLLWMVG